MGIINLKVKCMKNGGKKEGQAYAEMLDPNNLSDSLVRIGFWLTGTLGGNPQFGPHSEAHLGEPAVIYYPKFARAKYLEGTWTRDKGETLYKFLLRITRSEMGHQYEKWKKYACPMVMMMNNMNEQQLSDMEQSNEELAECLKREQKAMDVAYEIAEEEVKDDPELMKYLEAMKKGNDYRAISKKLRITKGEVVVLEERLLARLALMHKKKEAEVTAKIELMMTK